MMKLEVKKYVDKHFKNVNQFAVAIGIGYQAARKIYNGETSMIAFDTLEKMCEVFNCTPNDLLIIDTQSNKSKLFDDCPEIFNLIKTSPLSGISNKNASPFSEVSFPVLTNNIKISPETQKEIADITNKFSTYLSSLLINEITEKIKDDDK